MEKYKPFKAIRHESWSNPFALNPSYFFSPFPLPFAHREPWALFLSSLVILWTPPTSFSLFFVTPWRRTTDDPRFSLLRSRLCSVYWRQSHRIYVRRLCSHVCQDFWRLEPRPCTTFSFSGYISLCLSRFWVSSLSPSLMCWETNLSFTLLSVHHYCLRFQDPKVLGLRLLAILPLVLFWCCFLARCLLISLYLVIDLESPLFFLLVLFGCDVLCLVDFLLVPAPCWSFACIDLELFSNLCDGCVLIFVCSVLTCVWFVLWDACDCVMPVLVVLALWWS